MNMGRPGSHRCKAGDEDMNEQTGDRKAEMEGDSSRERERGCMGNQQEAGVQEAPGTGSPVCHALSLRGSLRPEVGGALLSSGVLVSPAQDVQRGQRREGDMYPEKEREDRDLEREG